MTDPFISFDCQICGGTLIEQSYGVYKCRYCGKIWKKESVVKFDVILKQLARRRHTASHQEYVSNKDLKEICEKILDLNPDDFYSQFYIATCKEDASLENFIASIDIEKHYDDIDEMVEYLIRGLKPRWINATSTLIEKAYEKNDMKKFHDYRTSFEGMADKVKRGIFDPRIPRDIFIAYSSEDKKKVDELLRVLEVENGLACFVSSRNMRHGSGAVENYWDALHTAMQNCKAVVFISSTHSRDSGCDAIEELRYIKEHLPKMRRIEFAIESYKGVAAESIVKNFFYGLEYCKSAQDVAKRYFDQMSEETAKYKAKEEAEAKHKAEQIAKEEAAAEAAKRKKEAKEAKSRERKEAKEAKSRERKEAKEAKSREREEAIVAKCRAKAESAAAKEREKELKAIEAKRRAQRFAEATAEFFTKLLRFLLVLAIIGASIALIGAFIYFYPQLGIWAMIFIGVAVGAIFVIIGMVALKRSYARNRTLSKIIGLYILAIAIAVGLIFVSRETAYISLPFIIIVSVYLFGVICTNIVQDAYMIIIFLLIAVGSLILYAIQWTTSWGMSPVSFDGATVTYNLNRSEEALTVEYYNNKNILGGINAPNADTVIIENGYKTLLNGSLSNCDGMFALYIPSSVTEIQEKAIAKCESLKAVYIGYNADGTPSSDTSSLRKIGFDAFANSPINVIYYNGSISEWESITKDGQDVLFLGKTEWNKNMGSFEVICNDGTLEYNK